MSALELIASPRKSRRIPGRFKVRDIAIQFRMGAGFAGDVNRSHPANIEPCLIDATLPPTAYGQAVFGDTVSQGVRPIIVGTDAGTSIYGVTTRPYPVSQTTGGMSATIGAAVPPTSGVTDVLKNGYILVPVVGQTTKFGVVYVWIAASGGGHTAGGFEAAASGGNTAILAGAMWNGAPDANGLAELILNF
jgi:hypothetical protein